MFVSGTIKTTRWVTAAFYGSKRSNTAVISCGVTDVGSLSASLSFSAELLGHHFLKYGPSESAIDMASSNFNQSQAAGIICPPVPESSERAAVQAALPTGSQVGPTQTLFLNYYKMKTRRWRAPKVIRAAAGSPHLPEYPDDESGGAVFGRSRSYSAGTSEADSDLYDTVCTPLICLENASQLCCPFRPLVPSTAFWTIS